MALEPQQDVIVLEMLDENKDSGIIVPDSVATEKEEGTVFKIVGIGPGYWDSGKFIATTLQKGEYIITAAYGLSKFTYKGKKVLLTRERDVILKVRGVV